MYYSLVVGLDLRQAVDLGFLSVTEKLDEIRSENFSECFSEFYRILVDGGINEEPWVVREYFRPVSQ